MLRQYERGVVFLLGKFEGVRGPGLTLIFVPIQQMVRVSLRTVTMQIPSQKIITKDNVSIDIAAVAYYHISDPEKAVIVIENVYNAINQISQTTVRNVVGRFSLDQLLSDTASINEQIKNVIDRHTEPWGTQVTAVEIKDIVLPDNMQRAMAKEAEAERERRAKIVAAEGEFQAAVKLGQAADIITQHPVALQLRTLQTMAEISVEKNSTIIFPAQFMTTVQEALAMVTKDFSIKIGIGALVDGASPTCDSGPWRTWSSHPRNFRPRLHEHTIRSRSVLGDDRALPVEFVVDAGPHDVVGEARIERDRNGGIRQDRRHDRDRTEIDVEVFHLRGPIAGEMALESGADGPAGPWAVWLKAVLRALPASSSPETVPVVWTSPNATPPVT